MSDKVRHLRVRGRLYFLDEKLEELRRLTVELQERIRREMLHYEDLENVLRKHR